MTTTEPPRTVLSLAAACEHQDDLLVATSDLDRLGTLLADSYATLQSGLFEAARLFESLHADGVIDAATLVDARERVAPAMTALQAQDIAAQLIAHTALRLRRGAHRIANEAFADDDDGAELDGAPLRQNPVAQVDMVAGSVELF